MLLTFYYLLNAGLFLRDKLADQGYVCGVVINTEPPDLNKPFGQDVHGKASQEFNAIDGYRFFDSPVAVIFGNKWNLCSGNSLISNGQPVRDWI